MTEKLVGFHFLSKDNPSEHDQALFRSYGGIIDGIRDQGLDVAVTRGSDHFDFSEGVVDEVWAIDKTTQGIVTRKTGKLIPVDAFGAVRDYTKNLRPTPSHPLPLLNDPKVMAYDRSKMDSFTDLISDMQARTVLANVANIEMLDGDTIVLKPDNGRGGVGVEIVDRLDAQSILDRYQDRVMIAQEHVDMRQPFPPGIVGLNEVEQSKIEKLSGRKKEIRSFIFHSTGKTAAKVWLARFMKEGTEKNDIWVLIDPEKIPAALIEAAEIVFERLAAKTEVNEIYGAADFTWGSTQAQPELQWRVGEMNLWRPVFYRKGDPGITKQYDRNIANQLVRIAKSGANS